MAIIDSKTGKVAKKYSLKQLVAHANLMRGYNLISLNCAGSGHSGGTLSIMDLCAALYLQAARHDPKNPQWDDRDRIIWSAGHKAPALYVSLAVSGYFPLLELSTLRRFDSKLQGHPHHLKCKGVEVSTGSLGQGFGIGVGMALRGKLDKKDYKVFVITGDGEWDEGSMWESAMEAVHYRLDNLIVILDRNYLQIDGSTEEVMRLDPLEKRLRGFGFHLIKINGHNMAQIVNAFNKARKVIGKPVVIVAKTVKGKGVSFMENVASWHGKSPDDIQLLQALKELKLTDKIDISLFKKKAAEFQKEADNTVAKLWPRFGKNYYWNKNDKMKTVMEPTRFGFGRALETGGEDKRVICIGLDISESVQISKFYDKHLERKPRFLSVGIAEQGATTVAAGLAKEGKLPVMSTYGVFCAQRNADQMRTSVCYGEFDVLFGGAHGGVSVGPDGATHQALEEISVVSILPNMKLVAPCDSIETQKATDHLLFKVKGPKYIRFAREATPVVTDASTPFVFGKANVIRYIGEKENFIDAFRTVLGDNYQDHGETISLIACGPLVPEAMRSAWILQEEYNLKTRVINMHTIKPLDKETIVKAAKETEIIVTVEEHQKGGFGNQIAAVILEANLDKNLKFSMIGVEDRFGESGSPWELIKVFGLTAEHITKRVLKLAK